MSRPIEDYALIGDGNTAALVSRDGSIDWLCWPRFDDDACFAALLGTSDNGCWTIAPAGRIVRQARRYQEDTLVLESDFEVDGGAVRVTDFMPVGDGPRSLVRIVTGLGGVVDMRSELRLRFNYGELEPLIERIGGELHACIGPDRVVLRTGIGMDVSNGAMHARFIVKAGECVSFALSYARAHEAPPAPLDALPALRDTQRFWRDWIARFDDNRTAWPQAVRRSLLTLKALMHHRTGAIVAAPTTSLPEAPGGRLNWDYRYAWLRDTSFAMVALLNAGYHEEARAWRDWLLRTIASAPEHSRIMYRVDGGRHLREWTVDWLPGHRYAKPVRVGNAAAHQHQLDVLGEVIDCLDVARRGGLAPADHEGLIETRIVEHLEKVWRLPGAGIWESRGEPRHYTYSRVMLWVALDRFLNHRAAEGGPSPLVERMAALREHIRDEVLREGWNAGLGSFTQYYGSEAFDASLLLMPLVGFLSADDPRMASTIERIRRDLCEDGLIRRRKRHAGDSNEGTFLACSCWTADCLNLQGRSEDARQQFERVLATANDVGLFSEQYNAQRRELAGNFPQALSHLAVVNTALGLCGRTLQRGGG
ncbi:glycoside hydrolase family 15 protein [Caballeronia concitans]|uniref:Glycosyl hydrolase family protein n=1 Tax=Caballeronia concitans TaxID=1777133 RepID=A0A658QTE8_9BURK|nr:glycoside hydrolase family 15 protein [Caballeronia concitans]KIG10868.1 glycoside hydrolase 15-related protein [Burkholderia sp. MR1]SAL20026.1 glycosyl hydrolase family protein [Caballeronia concitans]